MSVAFEIWLGAAQSIPCGPAATDLTGRTSLDAETAEDELRASDTAGCDILNASSHWDPRVHQGCRV